MVAATRAWARDLHYVWFHHLSPSDWYRGGEHVDALLRQRFAGHWHALRGQPAASFLDSPRGALAAVLLFDQVPRNIFREDPRAFASDPLARAIAKETIARGWHRLLDPQERQFLYMPLMHSESIADQRTSLRLFAQLGRSLSFARSHYAMIARFGRFPHRNAVLGRTSSAAEARAIEAGNAW